MSRTRFAEKQEKEDILGAVIAGRFIAKKLADVAPAPKLAVRSVPTSVNPYTALARAQTDSLHRHFKILELTYDLGDELAAELADELAKKRATADGVPPAGADPEKIFSNPKYKELYTLSGIDFSKDHTFRERIIGSHVVGILSKKVTDQMVGGHSMTYSSELNARVFAEISSHPLASSAIERLI
ncbi:MAG: hypothetical protein V4482_06785, partial [Pseudomonadota bacterium]